MTLSIETLVSLGGREWKTDGGAKHRVYFNEDVQMRLCNVIVSRYGTGNISSVKVNGEFLSNNKGRAYIARFSSPVFYDVTAGRFVGNSDVVAAITRALAAQAA